MGGNQRDGALSSILGTFPRFRNVENIWIPGVDRLRFFKQETCMGHGLVSEAANTCGLLFGDVLAAVSCSSERFGPSCFSPEVRECCRISARL